MREVAERGRGLKERNVGKKKKKDKKNEKDKKVESERFETGKKGSKKKGNKKKKGSAKEGSGSEAREKVGPAAVHLVWASDGDGIAPPPVDTVDASTPGAAPSATTSLVVASRVREAVRARELRLSADFVEALNARIEQTIAVAVARAKDNGRSTVRGQDL